MQILIGLVVLAAFALGVGAMLHWTVGVAVIALPILITYVRLKISPAYREDCDRALEAVTARKS